MVACTYQKGDELTESIYQTKEPKTKSVDTDIIDIVFVPALMADKNLHRLGYGGGFYDRFLAKNCKNAKKIVAIPSALITDELPTHIYDAKIDMIISEENL